MGNITNDWQGFDGDGSKQWGKILKRKKITFPTAIRLKVNIWVNSFFNNFSY